MSSNSIVHPRKMSSENKGVYISAKIALTGRPKLIKDFLLDAPKTRGIKYDVEAFPEDIGVVLLVNETSCYRKFSDALENFLKTLSPLIGDEPISVVQVTLLVRSDVVSSFLVSPSLSKILAQFDSSLFISLEPANGVERCLSQDEKWRTNQST